MRRAKRTSTAAKRVGSGRRQSTRSLASVKRRHFTEEEKRHALELVSSGMTMGQAAEAVGCCPDSIRLWRHKLASQIEEEAEAGPSSADQAAKGTSGVEGSTVTASGAAAPQAPGKSAEQSVSPQAAGPIYRPRDPGQGLGAHEVDAILAYKQKHPSMQPAQLRAQLKRFKGWRLSVKAIAKVLRDHGYELVHRGSRPEGPEPIRFEAPRRNALWQADFGEFRVEGERLHLLAFLDDFSRYVVGWTLADSQSGEVAVKTLQAAVARHGKPEAVRTDRGGGFLSGELTGYLQAELIDHVVGRSYHPQGGGKIESLIGTVRRELWEVEHFEDRARAEQRLGEFFEGYNERRAHLGIDGLTPADRFFGRADQVLAAIDALSRRRQGALDQLGAPGAGIEELAPAATGAPLEVLRLVVVDGGMEMRFCGNKVRLGSMEG